MSEIICTCGSHVSDTPCALCEEGQCSLCGELIPKWVLKNQNNRCVGCDVKIYAASRDVAPGMCHHCEKPLVPIGNARRNGASHDDWATRKYHKKCWRELQRDD